MEINRNEVLRYLGYKNQQIDIGLNNLINDCITETLNLVQPLSVYRTYEIEKVDNTVKIADTSLSLLGRDISEHLKRARKCAIMAVTLGIAIDREIKIMELTNMTRALVMDACATAAVESVCDEVEREILALAKEKGLDINYRFSPGYGDFPIEQQPIILELLNTQKRIGLNCTDNFILIPRKSVTAVIGLIDKDSSVLDQRKCGDCKRCNKYSDCLYRKVEVSFEH